MILGRVIGRSMLLKEIVTWCLGWCPDLAMPVVMTGLRTEVNTEELLAWTVNPLPTTVGRTTLTAGLKRYNVWYEETYSLNYFFNVSGILLWSLSYLTHLHVIQDQPVSFMNTQQIYFLSPCHSMFWPWPFIQAKNLNLNCLSLFPASSVSLLLWFSLCIM